MTERLFKVLEADGKAHFSGAIWSLPDNDKPGKWMSAVKGELVICENGYHLCREGDLVDWLKIGTEIYEAEARGDRLDRDTKIAVREARLIRRLDWDGRARLFACDCAERSLKYYERDYPDDNRLRDAIHIARKYATGDATGSELSAARDAARAAAWTAARDAACWDAARAATWAAAWDAARDAARDAAWAAAWDAARAAAWDAARDAARDAACAAAWDAEREWQTRRLMQYLEGDL